MIRYAFDRILALIFLFCSIKSDIDNQRTTVTEFTGNKFWTDQQLQLCGSPPPFNQSLSCYSYVLYYQRLNTEVLSEDPFLIIFRGFCSRLYVDDFLADIKGEKLVRQSIFATDSGVKNVFGLHLSRQANGTWIGHVGKRGVAKTFRRVVAMMPFLNFESSEPWQISSYQRGGHFAPHHDFIQYTSPDNWCYWRRFFGNRFATLLLILKTADKGGGTVFPFLNITIMPSPGDVILWANIDTSMNKEHRSLHAACPIWEGEKVAAALWIRCRDQEMLKSLLNNSKFDLDKLIHPRLEFLGMSLI